MMHSVSITVIKMIHNCYIMFVLRAKVETDTETKLTPTGRLFYVLSLSPQHL